MPGSFVPRVIWYFTVGLLSALGFMTLSIKFHRYGSRGQMGWSKFKAWESTCPAWIRAMLIKQEIGKVWPGRWTAQELASPGSIGFSVYSYLLILQCFMTIVTQNLVISTFLCQYPFVELTSRSLCSPLYIYWISAPHTSFSFIFESSTIFLFFGTCLNISMF